ncbi:MAG: LysR family transcriptional regulator [Bdellovibrionota bacterium]
MELNHLRVFYEVARRGGFTAAARALCVSQPSLSRSVKLLEDAENVRLLERGKRGVALTPEGRLFFASCERVFGELENLRLIAGQSKGEITGSLSIAASDNICNHVLPRLHPAFARANPKVRTRLFSGTSEQILEELRSRQAELGLFYTEVKDARTFTCEKLWSVEFVLVCGAQHQSPSMETLGFVGSRAVDYAKAYPALAMLRSAGMEPRTVFETNNQETQKQLVLAGYGCTLVPRHMVEGEIKSGKLKRMKTPKTLGGHVFLVSRRGQPLSRAAEAWREAVFAFDYKNLY